MFVFVKWIVLLKKGGLIMSDVFRYVVVPCKMDQEGKIVVTSYWQNPFGYHHILRCSLDGPYLLVATVFCSVAEDDVLSIAQVLAREATVVVDPDFYRNYEIKHCF